MILVGGNLLLYAHVESFQQHVAAHDWLDGRLNGQSRVGLPWESLLAFVRLMTNPRVFEPPEAVPGARQQVAHWLSCKTVWNPQPSLRHTEVLGQLLSASDVHANLVSDAHLAALTIEHGLTLCSTDSGFPFCAGRIHWARDLRTVAREIADDSTAIPGS